MMTCKINMHFKSQVYRPLSIHPFNAWGFAVGGTAVARRASGYTYNLETHFTSIIRYQAQLINPRVVLPRPSGNMSIHHLDFASFLDAECHP